MRLDIVQKTPSDAYLVMLWALLTEAKRMSPRGIPTKEIRSASVTIENPRAGFIVSKSRALNPFFASAELAWILAGSNDLTFIERFNKTWRKFSDDGLTLHGAYGFRMKRQLDHIVQLFEEDPYTRQGVISIWNESDRASVKTKDRPCNTQLQFYRDFQGRLGLIVTVRSQDIVYGFPYDTFVWTMLQKMVAMSLNWAVGKYRVNFGSLHIYEMHESWGYDMIEQKDFQGIDVPVFDLDISRGIAGHLVERFTKAFHDGPETLPEDLKYLPENKLRDLDLTYLPLVIKALEVSTGIKDPQAYTFLSQTIWGTAVDAWQHRGTHQRPSVATPEEAEAR